MIKLEIIEKSFPSVQIFKDTMIEIEAGSLIAIKGESGSGKTTLLKMLGFLADFNGNYYFNNQLIDYRQKEDYRRQLITYVFQTHHLVEYESVYWNITMPLKNLKQKINEDKIKEYALFLGVHNLLDKEVKYLSIGEKQRVSVLRALLTNRPVILADEPTGSLDANNVIFVMDLLKQINEKYKRTIVMVTHDNHLDSYFDKIYYIRDHKII